VPRDVNFAGEQHQEGTSSNDLMEEAEALEGLVSTSHQSRVTNYGLTASLISPLRDFMRAKACGKSAKRISSVTNRAPKYRHGEWLQAPRERTAGCG